MGERSLSHKKVEVACLGILVADFFPSPLPRLPEPGELMLVDQIAHYTGGCAANTAVALAKLGIRAGVVGKVGRDPFGRIIIDDLAQKGVEVSQIGLSSQKGTSKTLIIPTVSEDRRYIHMIGANADFCIDDVNFDYLSRVRILYVGGYLALSRLDQGSLIAILKFAKQRGIITVLDIVLAGGRNALAECKDALRYVDAFLPNDDEAKVLTGEDDPSKQAEFLLQFGPGMVVITLGGEGSLLKSKDKTIRAFPYQVDFVDGSGAGDAFDAGFITGLLSNWSSEDTLEFASAMGASCVRKLGCTAGLFSMQEAKEFISRNKSLLEVQRGGSAG